MYQFIFILKIIFYNFIKINVDRLLYYYINSIIELEFSLLRDYLVEYESKILNRKSESKLEKILIKKITNLTVTDNIKYL